MKITTIMFDLDGTLLPMDNDEFTKKYFGLLTKYMTPYGYEAKALTDAVWTGTAAMVRNNGSEPNEKTFWKKFAEIYGEKSLDDLPIFDEFYRTDFCKAKEFCGCNPKAAETVHKLKENGYRTVLATNPIFPAIATESRIGWAGVSPDDFELYTTYENIGYCKPNPEYYREIARRVGVSPEECLMVGNDVDEDMKAAQAADMNVFLLTDNVINRGNDDISVYPHGSYNELWDYIASPQFS